MFLARWLGNPGISSFEKFLEVPSVETEDYQLTRHTVLVDRRKVLKTSIIPSLQQHQAHQMLTHMHMHLSAVVQPRLQYLQAQDCALPPLYSHNALLHSRLPISLDG